MVCKEEIRGRALKKRVDRFYEIYRNLRVAGNTETKLGWVAVSGTVEDDVDGIFSMDLPALANLDISEREFIDKGGDEKLLRLVGRPVIRPVDPPKIQDLGLQFMRLFSAAEEIPIVQKKLVPKVKSSAARQPGEESDAQM